MTTALQDTPATLPDELKVGSERLTFRVTSEQSDGQVAVMQVRMPAGGGPPLLHRHDAFELYRVESGKLTFYLEGENGAVTRSVVGPGGVVPIAGGLEHTIRNESSDDAEAVVLFSPGEEMERFVRAASELSRGRAPQPHELVALAEAHGIGMTRSVEDALADASDRLPERGAGYLSITRFSGDGEQLLGQYENSAAAMDAVGRDHGLILHAAARTDDGLLTVNLWPAKEGSEAASRDPRRLGVLERSEVDLGKVRREHFEPAHFVRFD
ncbi:MAG TPA: cupin domain-containing protein [Thermoleophilaceae bacterium]|nr:cupin domain-containing protein [Thermoleophilaceae bacterium]